MDEQDDRRPSGQGPEDQGPPPAPAPPPGGTSSPDHPTPDYPPPAPEPAPRVEQRPDAPGPAAIPTFGPFDPPPAPVGGPIDVPTAQTASPTRAGSSAQPPPEAPRRTATTTPRPRPPRPDDFDEAFDDPDDSEEEYDEPSRWVTLLSSVGLGMIGIVTVQVLASLVQGLTTKSGDRLQGVPDDLLHRMGYPFDSLGSTALLFLVVGVVLLALPAALDEFLPDRHERSLGLALKVAIAVAAIVAIGSVLAVRATLHLYSASNAAVPTGERVRFTTFLLGALGAAALAIYTALSALNQRARERWDG